MSSKLSETPVTAEALHVQAISLSELRCGVEEVGKSTRPRLQAVVSRGGALSGRHPPWQGSPGGDGRGVDASRAGGCVGNACTLYVPLPFWTCLFLILLQGGSGGGGVGGLCFFWGSGASWVRLAHWWGGGCFFGGGGGGGRCNTVAVACHINLHEHTYSRLYTGVVRLLSTLCTCSKRVHMY